MSSISIDGSGARGITLTVNDPARSAASMPTKPGDDLSMSVGGVGEVFIGVSPQYATFRKVKTGNGETWVLVLKGSVSAVMLAASETAWPHASVRALKGVTNYYGGEVLEERAVHELLGLEAPTEG